MYMYKAPLLLIKANYNSFGKTRNFNKQVVYFLDFKEEDNKFDAENTTMLTSHKNK